MSRRARSAAPLGRSTLLVFPWYAGAWLSGQLVRHGGQRITPWASCLVKKEAWLNTAPRSEVERFHDADFCAAVRTRLCQEVLPPGLRCSNTYSTGPRAGEHCADDLDTKGTHASTCKVCLLYTSDAADE